MSVESSPFGPLRVTGEDAVALHSQLRRYKPHPSAMAAARRGQRMLTQLDQDGCCTIDLREAAFDELKEYVVWKRRGSFSRLART